MSENDARTADPSRPAFGGHVFFKKMSLLVWSRRTLVRHRFSAKKKKGATKKNPDAGPSAALLFFGSPEGGHLTRGEFAYKAIDLKKTFPLRPFTLYRSSDDILVMACQ